MKYIPATEQCVAHMLAAIGVESVDALFESSIPAPLLLKQPLELPPGMSEFEVADKISGLAGQNLVPGQAPSFLGAGAYQHFIPVVIRHLVHRGEFLTAYTPYQPEIAQGTLQAIYEFQTLVAELLGMEIANASMYDGASSVAEAVLMSVRLHRGKRGQAILAGALHPDTKSVCATYCSHGAVELVGAKMLGGRIDTSALAEQMSEQVACVVVQSPNFYGLIEDLAGLRALCDEHGAHLIVSFSDPHAFGLFRSPGSYGADIVAGEGQALGIPMSYGGPYAGVFACRKAFVRQMPGRLCGRTVDADGKDGFVLTLSTREQHIRRGKATSNICTNQGLCALMSTIHMSLLGPGGLAEVATQCHAKAAYLRQGIGNLSGFELAHEGPFFHEFVVRTPVPAAQLVDALASDGIIAGLALSHHEPERTHELLVTATEVHSRETMDAFVTRLGSVT